jgi:hypothetical protein
MTIFYHRVADPSIPREVSQDNIILTLDGMKALSQYYKEKYQIDIIPFAAVMGAGRETGSEVLCELLDKKRREVSSQDSYRCGFVFHNLLAGEHGHAMPIIWEKNGADENLFFLDSGQYLGNVSYDERDCDLIFKPDFSERTDLSVLQGDAEIAYVLCQEGVLFVDKKNNKCINISAQRNWSSGKTEIDEEKCMKVYELIQELNLAADHCKKLSPEERSKMVTITHFDINNSSREPRQFRDRINQRMPNIKIWSHVGTRQADHSSCTIDAMVTLKDGLRIDPSLTVQAQDKFIAQQQGVNLFYMPEGLLKTAQIASFAADKSKANPDKVMHVHREKDAAGKKTGVKKLVTLKEFREKYEVPVAVKGETKKFSTYTIKKGKKIAAILDARAEQATQLEGDPQKQSCSIVTQDTVLVSQKKDSPMISTTEDFKVKLQEIRQSSSMQHQELTEDEAKGRFLAAHRKMFSDAKAGCSGFFRKIRVTDNMSLKDILEHAMKSNNRSREVCINLGWLDKKGAIKQDAPTVIKTQLTEKSPLPPFSIS